MGSIKISWEQAEEIRARKATGVASKVLALNFDVSKVMINYIVAGKFHMVPDARSRSRRKHRAAGTPLYLTWVEMRRRCYNSTRRDYQYYGQRGVSVCYRWRWSFEAFSADVGSHPGPGFSIDRIDSAGNYEPGNVRWATAKEQNNNRRPRRHYKGKPVPR